MADVGKGILFEDNFTVKSVDNPVKVFDLGKKKQTSRASLASRQRETERDRDREAEREAERDTERERRKAEQRRTSDEGQRR